VAEPGIQAVKTAGIRDFTPYSLRHTFGARLATADVSMLKLAKLMGNSAVICERYYATLHQARCKKR